MAVTTRNIEARQHQSRWPVVQRLNSALSLGLSLIALVTLVLALQTLSVWGQQRLDDIRYGRPRTVHLAGVTGSGDSAEQPTHVIAMNLEGQISILVLPHGDTSQITTLPGPYVIGQDGWAAVPQPELRDITGDGLADLLVTIRGETIVYLNKSGVFSLITPEERANLSLAHP